MKRGTTSRIVLRQPGGRWKQFRHDNPTSDTRDTQDKRPEPELVAQKGGNGRRSDNAS
ncbi:hypothetical protein HY374_02405 [Candidatus Berkelbacteria bacterium]|nr:hypothetical protein [Candidatus Berkelbacteria bacterium]